MRWFALQLASDLVQILVNHASMCVCVRVCVEPWSMSEDFVNFAARNMLSDTVMLILVLILAVGPYQGFLSKVFSMIYNRQWAKQKRKSTVSSYLYKLLFFVCLFCLFVCLFIRSIRHIHTQRQPVTLKTTWIGRPTGVSTNKPP